MDVDYDAVIVGGGLGGLSLAAHLATGGWGGRRVLVVDDRDARPGAVCWGSWSAEPGLLDAAESRTYHQIRVRSGGLDRVLPLTPYRYRLVRRRDLRRVVKGLLRERPGYAFAAGRVVAIQDRPDAALVRLTDGRVLRARWVFDSAGVAPLPPPRHPPAARLAFTGWEVRCERPVFDPRTPVLFDFDTPQSGAARFVYVLPDGPHRALVELTEFASRRIPPVGPGEAAAALTGYLDQTLRAGAYDILRTESAVLPLRVTPPLRASGGVLAIGARGGLIKASTGYAYQRVQRDSAAIAASLVRHGHPFGIPRPSLRHRALDAVLLGVLDRDPAELQRAFTRLFATNPAPRVLRFLDEQTGPLAELRLIASLPPLPYLRAAAGLGPRLLRSP